MNSSLSKACNAIIHISFKLNFFNLFIWKTLPIDNPNNSSINTLYEPWCPKVITFGIPCPFKFIKRKASDSSILYFPIFFSNLIATGIFSFSFIPSYTKPKSEECIKDFSLYLLKINLFCLCPFNIYIKNKRSILFYTIFY